MQYEDAPDSTAAHLTSWLLQEGLLSNELLATGRIVYEDRARRNMNLKLIPSDGPRFFIKQSPPSAPAASRATLRREARFLHALRERSELAHLRPLVPALVRHDAATGRLVTALEHPATTLFKFHQNRGRPRFPVHAARSWARLLALVHRTRTALPASILPRDRPTGWKVLPTFLPTPTSEVPPVYNEFARALAPFRHLGRRLTRLQRRWDRESGLVHGDPRWENVLITAGNGPDGGLNLRLIDWELVSRGDPWWDVTCALTEYVRFRLSSAPNGATSVRQFEASALVDWRDLHTSAGAFWNTYTANHPVDEATFQRILDYLPFAIIWIAAEATMGQERLAYRVHHCLRWAAQAAADPARALRTWLGVEDVA